MAANVSVTGFREIYDMFPEISDETVQVYLNMAILEVGLDRDCLRTDERRETAIYALTAHYLFMLKKLGGNGASGPVSNATQGSVSTGFAVPTVNLNTWYAQSPYGQYYWQLMALCRLRGAQINPNKFHPWG